MSDAEKTGYIVEFTHIGKALKVTACDPKTMREVSLVGSLRVSKRELAKLAIRKLEYVMHKDKAAD